MRGTPEGVLILNFIRNGRVAIVNHYRYSKKSYIIGQSAASLPTSVMTRKGRRFNDQMLMGGSCVVNNSEPLRYDLIFSES